MRYLIAYDITHPKRLRRVSKLLARHALRCQKSVYLLTERGMPLPQLLARVEPLLDSETDLLQAWALSNPMGNPVAEVGCPSHLETGVAVLGPEGNTASSPRRPGKVPTKTESIAKPFME